MPTVRFVKQNVSVHCAVGTNLRRLALDNGIDLYSIPNNLLNCWGNGLCGTCRVKVDDPRAVNARRTPSDERKTGWEGPQYRLACQTQVLADVEVTTNPRRVLGWANHPTYEWMREAE
jgi:ferredoxin